MTRIGGADGCPGGWLLIERSLDSAILSAADLFRRARHLDVLTIDVPIGLSDTGSRQCDMEARGFIKPRSSSVFPAPLRPVLFAKTYLEACEISRTVQKKAVSKQGWEIYARIRDVDAMLRSDPDLRSRVYEVHPEVCFRAWAGKPLDRKRSLEGANDRLRLIESHFGNDAFSKIRRRHSRGQATDDDILDGFAALWTAERIANGNAASLPADPPLDSEGLPMRMMY